MQLGRQDLAGKTGTTNESVDAWFCGYNGAMVAVAWIGFDQPQEARSAVETGSVAALPIWMAYHGQSPQGRTRDSAQASRKAWWSPRSMRKRACATRQGGIRNISTPSSRRGSGRRHRRARHSPAGNPQPIVLGTPWLAPTIARRAHSSAHCAGDRTTHRRAGLGDWAAAKRKACRELGLPDDRRCRATTRSNRRCVITTLLFRPTTHAASLAPATPSRDGWMERLPLESGAGRGARRAGRRRHSDVRLELEAEDPKTVELALINAGVDYTGAADQRRSLRRRGIAVAVERCGVPAISIVTPQFSDGTARARR